MIFFGKVFCSPLKRAQETCTLAEFEPEITPDLAEWNYGAYEGLTTPEIHQKDPSWNIFEKGAPEGESSQDIVQRAQRLLQFLQNQEGVVAFFSSGHILRAFTTQWLGLPLSAGKNLALSPASISILGFERDTP